MIKTIATTIVMVALLALPAVAQSPLAGTSWRFIEVAGAPVGIPTQISFVNDGNVSGNSGCNSFHGRYGGDSSILAFSTMGWTKMLCPDAPTMSVETAIQSALAGTRSFTIAERTLHILGTDGAILARLETAAPN
jgi:heat shock protein HslJ